MKEEGLKSFGFRFGEWLIDMRGETGEWQQGGDREALSAYWPFKKPVKPLIAA